MSKETLIALIIGLALAWLLTACFIWRYYITAKYIENGYVQRQCVGKCGTIWVKPYTITLEADNAKD